MLFALLAFSADTFAKTVKETKFTANMTCETCKGKIEKALNSEKGVLKSNADVASKAVTVSYDADVVSDAAIKKTVAKLGYTVDGTKEAKTMTKDKKGACTDDCKKSCDKKK